MKIKVSDTTVIKEFLQNIKLPPTNSHKGTNGKLLIVGGSSLFHSASIWAAEIASHFVDMVHYASTPENEEIFLHLKKIFRNGIVVPKRDIMEYAGQDDCILIGPGMMREGSDGTYTEAITKELITKFPDKKFVFDAGALQMMKKDWFAKLKERPIITPHIKEFQSLFNIDLSGCSQEEMGKEVTEVAKKYGITILLKSITDYITDGEICHQVTGGNAGLTKGGTGDVLSGLAASLYTTNDSVTSSLSSSILLKATAEKLFDVSGYWYNVSDIINTLPKVLAENHGKLNIGVK